MWTFLAAWRRSGAIRRLLCPAPREPTREEALISHLSAAVADPRRADRIRVETGAISGGACGLAHVVGQRPGRRGAFVRGLRDADGFGWRVCLHAPDPPEARAVTLAHELAHVYCGHCGPSHCGDWIDRRDINRVAQEIEAECAAGVFAVAAGLNSSAPERLAAHLAEAKLQLDAQRFVRWNLVRAATERICREAALPTPSAGWFSRIPGHRQAAVRQAMPPR